jgi:anti-sigma factor RsiW
MASCGEIHFLLGPFDDGELEPHEMEEVALHVVTCPGCKAALDDYRALGVALRKDATAPVLDGFAQAVMARIVPARTPWRRRLGDIFGSLGRLGGVIEVAAIAAATALLTLMIAGPRIQHVLNQAVNAPPVAFQTAPPPMMPVVAKTPRDESAPPHVAQTDEPGEEEAARDTQGEVVSQLGAGDSPSVAVWNEPRTGTTVVWVPDQR